MKLEKLVGDRFKERPADCVIESHALMMRGGYIKHVGNGIYSSFAILKRITRKVEEIIRHEMDAIDGQEVLFPVVMPASLWEESGRFETVGKELLRFTDRNDTQMLLGMTHEEAAVQLVREYGQTYTKYPFMIYQIQTKFRDEARPRGGLIRVREFTMKDAYSYHTSQEDLDDYYEKCHEAYVRIYKKTGLKNVVSVASDSGMMGGKVSHEFMLLTPIGEDTIVVCDSCDFRANMESAESIVKNEDNAPLAELTKVHTPNMSTIEDVASFLNTPIEKSCKAVIYQKVKSKEYVIAFVRGDLEVNEAKLTRIVGEELTHGNVTLESGLVPGFLGPHGLSGVAMFFDASLKGISNLCCGANEVDYHFTGLNIQRDIENAAFHDFTKAIDGGICPNCGKSALSLTRGIEVGNIFQLGDKYTASMDMKYTDEKGEKHYPIMGCYGIGVGRLIASVVEESHDDYGPIWPISIAPWHIHLCCMKSTDADVKASADELYAKLLAAGFEVIYDDRPVSAGVMFSDADLLGVPIRVVASPRNFKENACEVSTRNKSVKELVKIDDVIDFVENLKSEFEQGC